MAETEICLNWTKVGLKGAATSPAMGASRGLNWTKVGLKVKRPFRQRCRASRLNWTKVGLKVKFFLCIV